MADNNTTLDNSAPNSVQLRFNDDFKSCMMWILVGVVGGVLLHHWMTNKKGGSLFN